MEKGEGAPNEGREEGGAGRLLLGMGQEVPEVVQQRIGVIQELIAYQGTEGYAGAQAQAAKQLGISIRSLQRLVKKWREEGILGLMPQARRDRGKARIGEDWQQFIVKTYREGNRGSRSLSPAQVAVRVKVRAQELGERKYPSHMTVYRILKPMIEQRQPVKRSLGWKGSRLTVKTRDGVEIAVEYSNQVWQADHTKVDVLVVDQSGEILGRPWLTLVVDTYSRCIMGMHLGFDAPSAAVVCLALRHAILPKQYSGGYELKQSWGTYGLPQYLYTDGGKDFRSQHLEQVATELGIVLCLRRQPSDGGIVERPFGTFNSDFFSTLPGYVGSNVTARSPVAESEACLTLLQLEKLLVRYLVDRYNPGIDARMGEQSRIGRWEAGGIAQLPLLGERELDLCLMRRDRRVVYRGGYVQFANLSYQGEHLAGYAGEQVIIRYNPRDITTVLIYQQDGHQERFLTRAHAVGLETEILAFSEAQAMSRRVRSGGKAVTNQSVLMEVRDREATVQKLQRQKQRKRTAAIEIEVGEQGVLAAPGSEVSRCEVKPPISKELSEEAAAIVVPDVVVHDYEELKRNYGKWW